MSRSVEDRHLNFGSCMGRSCAAHERPMQKSSYYRVSRFWCTFMAENSATEDLAKCYSVGRVYNTDDGRIFSNTNAPSTITDSQILIHHRWGPSTEQAYISGHFLCLMTTLTLRP